MPDADAVCTVVGSVADIVRDASGTDWAPLAGLTVTFHPPESSAGQARSYTDGVTKTLQVGRSIIATTRADGTLMDPRTGEAGVQIPATDSTKVDPVGGTWTMEVRDQRGHGMGVGEMSFAAPGGTTVDVVDIFRAGLPASDPPTPTQYDQLVATDAALQSAVSAHDAKLTELEATELGDVADLHTEVDANTASIGALQTSVSAHGDEITTLQGEMATNDTEITTLQGDLTALTTTVSTNTADIASLQTSTLTSDRWLEGVGQPEGAIAAPVGTRYTDTAATAGAVEWIKMTGTDANGWVVTVGDTGEVQIAASAYQPGCAPTGNGTWVRRINGTIWLHGEVVIDSAYSSGEPAVLLPSWCWAVDSRIGAHYDNSFSIWGYQGLPALRFNKSGPTTLRTGQAPYLPTSPWPTSL